VVCVRACVAKSVKISSSNTMLSQDTAFDGVRPTWNWLVTDTQLAPPSEHPHSQRGKIVFIARSVLHRIAARY